MWKTILQQPSTRAVTTGLDKKYMYHWCDGCETSPHANNDTAHDKLQASCFSSTAAHLPFTVVGCLCAGLLIQSSLVVLTSPLDNLADFPKEVAVTWFWSARKGVVCGERLGDRPCLVPWGIPVILVHTRSSLGHFGQNSYALRLIHSSSRPGISRFTVPMV